MSAVLSAPAPTCSLTKMNSHQLAKLSSLPPHLQWHCQAHFTKFHAPLCTEESHDILLEIPFNIGLENTLSCNTKPSPPPPRVFLEHRNPAERHLPQSEYAAVAEAFEQNFQPTEPSTYDQFVLELRRIMKKH
ncbi:uncharacterized protein LOC142784467 [Rhipicephalus microplus]|uniref:uncharacterized protein LOC142784467 n=1 Tax=Rhipicephalus microplus TaxID=6941 RepID=UPI003F6B0EF4